MASVPVMGGIGNIAGTPGGQNPVPGGVQNNAPVSTVTPPSAANPALANPVQVAGANPYVAPNAINPASPQGAVPSTAPILTPSGASPTQVGMPSTIQGNSDPNFYNGPSNDTVAGGLNQTYGAGLGTGIADILNNMGTVNDSAIQATIANTNLAAGQQYGNIQAQEAAGGVSPNSSTAALAAGDFYGNINSNLQQTIGQMELNQENTALNTLQTAGGQHGPNESTFDKVMSDIGDLF